MSKESYVEIKNKVDISKVSAIQQTVNSDSQLIQEIVDKLVKEFTEPLDDYMAYIEDILLDTKKPPTDRELDEFTLRLPTLLYFTGQAQEALGIKEDVCKAVRMELYNSSFRSSPGTISDKTALAELATQQEYIVNTCYTRAYKIVKGKMESAYEMLSAVKKVISRRMAEMGITNLS